jgi:phosphoenolpyruvate---glycerone phosphotransferase subunit DhaL
MDTANSGLIYEDFVQLLKGICRDAESYKDYLTDLDSAIGDGDLGITIFRGFQAVEKTLELTHENIGQLLVRAGIDFINAASSTGGLLIGSAMISAGKCMGNKASVTLSTFYDIVSCAQEEIMEKGKAVPGDKTMLDAIEPIRLSLEKSLARNEPVEEALKRAKEASEQGSEATRTMKATKGRSRWLGDRSIGHLDPGAAVISMIMKSIYLNCKKET